MTTQNKTFTPVPEGDVTVRVMGGTTKTYGDSSKNSIVDASYVDQSYAYGAFPHPDMSAPVSPVTNKRK